MSRRLSFLMMLQKLVVRSAVKHLSGQKIAFGGGGGGATVQNSSTGTLKNVQPARCIHAQTARCTHAQTARAAHLKKTAAQAIRLFVNSAVVEEGAHHAHNGAALLVAYCIKEGLHTPNGVNTCKQSSIQRRQYSCAWRGGGGWAGGQGCLGHPCQELLQQQQQQQQHKILSMGAELSHLETYNFRRLIDQSSPSSSDDTRQQNQSKPNCEYTNAPKCRAERSLLYREQYCQDCLML